MLNIHNLKNNIITFSIFTIIIVLISCHWTKKGFYKWPVNPEKWFSKEGIEFVSNTDKSVTIILQKVDSSFEMGGGGLISSPVLMYSKNIKFFILKSNNPRDTLFGRIFTDYNTATKRCYTFFQIDSFELEIKDFLEYQKSRKISDSKSLLLDGYVSKLNKFFYGYIDTFILCDNEELIAININNKIYKRRRNVSPR